MLVFVPTLPLLLRPPLLCVALANDLGHILDTRQIVRVSTRQGDGNETVIEDILDTAWLEGVHRLCLGKDLAGGLPPGALGNSLRHHLPW